MKAELLMGNIRQLVSDDWGGASFDCNLFGVLVAFFYDRRYHRAVPNLFKTEIEADKQLVQFSPKGFSNYEVCLPRGS